MGMLIEGNGAGWVGEFDPAWRSDIIGAPGSFLAAHRLWARERAKARILNLCSVLLFGDDSCPGRGGAPAARFEGIAGQLANLKVTATREAGTLGNLRQCPVCSRWSLPSLFSVVKKDTLQFHIS